MSATLSMTLSGSLSGLGVGSVAISLQEVIDTALSSGNRPTVNLASGNNTISVPTGATSVIINAGLTNTVVLILKGVAGDTGIKLLTTGWQKIALDPTQTSFVINASGTLTGLDITFV